MNTFVIILIIILVLIFIGQKTFFSEPFLNTNEPIKLYVFVSEHCPHCHTYIDNHHNDVSALMKSKGFDVQKVQSDGSEESTKLFDKYDVQFVPTGILVKGNKVYKRLNSNITPQSVKQAIEN
jgi:thiol-disulfide isomerase/thioredoxin